MNWSIGLRTQPACFGAGGSVWTGAVKDQCESHLAPSSIQRVSSAFCLSVSACPESGGGMRSSGFGSLIFLTSRLFAALPGTITPSSRNMASRVSKWNLVSRCFSSGPWQAKQLLERIGRMSRLKLSGGEDADACGARPVVRAESVSVNSRQAAATASDRIAGAVRIIVFSRPTGGTMWARRATARRAPRTSRATPRWP